MSTHQPPVTCWVVPMRTDCLQWKGPETRFAGRVSGGGAPNNRCFHPFFSLPGEFFFAGLAQKGLFFAAMGGKNPPIKSNGPWAELHDSDSGVAFSA